MKPILEIQNISKKFEINHETQPYLSLRDSISGFFSNRNKKSKEEFWALQDVSFDVMPGETIGIIGKNGAGKSTLLKILSKITPPTKGKIISRGRIASLLEVGTGFHPELTGRENIFMNGSILGMKRTEILRNFDAIVDFSGVEKFIDTPLKHYSSGMQLRLAFAVAAFLENEILIIDEVLAVGDAEFQKKCMGKMEDVSRSGRTILFVSHQFNSLTQICQNGLLLSAGKKVFQGTIKDAINYYNTNLFSKTGNTFIRANDPKKDMCITEVTSLPANGIYFDFSEPIVAELKITMNSKLPSAKLGYALTNSLNNRVCSDYTDVNQLKQDGNIITARISLQGGVFAPGTYNLSFGIVIPNGPKIDILENALRFDITDVNGQLLAASGVDYGDVILKTNWK